MEEREKIKQELKVNICLTNCLLCNRLRYNERDIFEELI